MSGISSVGGVSNAVFQAQYQVKVLKLGQDAVNEQGQRALELIQAASSATSGQNLDVSI
jgi:hypothetical protein